jgi:hypothetical protein
VPASLAKSPHALGTERGIRLSIGPGGRGQVGVSHDRIVLSGIAQMRRSATRLRSPVIDLMQIHNLVD